MRQGLDQHIGGAAARGLLSTQPLKRDTNGKPEHQPSTGGDPRLRQPFITWKQPHGVGQRLAHLRHAGLKLFRPHHPLSHEWVLGAGSVGIHPVLFMTPMTEMNETLR